MDKDFFDNALDKAKNAFEVAYKKTSDVLSTEKIKFNISSLKSKREKLYSALGKNYFDSLTDISSLNNEDKSICDSISEINTEIEKLKSELEFAKSNRVCPNCGVAIDDTAVFCPKCGSKVIFDSTENENE